MRTAILTYVGLLGLVCGCNSSPPDEDSLLKPRIGTRCRVQFRRDALGTAASLPVSPMTGETNGASVTIDGTLTQVGGRWIVIRDNSSGEFFVSRESVLMLEFGR